MKIYIKYINKDNDIKESQFTDVYEIFTLSNSQSIEEPRKKDVSYSIKNIKLCVLLKNGKRIEFEYDKIISFTINSAE